MNINEKVPGPGDVARKAEEVRSIMLAVASIVFVGLGLVGYSRHKTALRITGIHEQVARSQWKKASAECGELFSASEIPAALLSECVKADVESARLGGELSFYAVWLAPKDPGVLLARARSAVKRAGAEQLDDSRSVQTSQAALADAIKSLQDFDALDGSVRTAELEAEMQRLARTALELSYANGKAAASPDVRADAKDRDLRELCSRRRRATLSECNSNCSDGKYLIAGMGEQRVAEGCDRFCAGLATETFDSCVHE